MGKLRVIAVEKNSSNSVDTQNVFACIYVDGVLYLYGAEDDELISDYFSNIEMLDYFVDAGKYEWTNFFIDKGQKIYRNRFDEILVDNEQVDAFTVVNPEKQISRVSAKIFYELLKMLNKDNQPTIKFLEESNDINMFRQELQKIIDQSDEHEISENDKEVIVRANIRGHVYIIDKVKQMFPEASGNYNPLYYLFARLFKLETDGYIHME